MRLALLISVVLSITACGDDDGGAEDAAGEDMPLEDMPLEDMPLEDMPLEDSALPPPMDFGVVPSESLPFAADPPGEWLPGDFHVHATGASNDTGGESLPADIKRVAMERGLYFVVLTDHSNSTGSDPSTLDEDPALFNRGPEFPYWDVAAELSEPGVFLMMDGNEISPVDIDGRLEPRGHVGCIPPGNPEDLDRSGGFIDRPRGDVTGGDGLRQALDRGCLAILHHPYSLTPWTAFDWSDSGVEGWGYHGMEVWNGTAQFGVDDEASYDAWRCDLLAGRTVAAIASSDNHRVFEAVPGGLFDPPLGFPKTYVFAADRGWAAIVAGVRAGRTTLGAGDSRVRLDAYDDAGDVSDGTGASWLRLRIQADAVEARFTLVVRRATSCDDPRPATEPPPTLTDEVLLEMPVAPGAQMDIAVPIDGAAGLYTAALEEARRRYSAFSQPVLLR